MMHTDEIDYIFSDAFVKEKSYALWERHLHWLATLGWERAYEKKQFNETFQFDPSGHEVVDLLRQFVLHTGYVNAHIGLTSSDIIDNVRLMQVQRSLQILVKAVAPVLLRINERFNHPIDTIGFTHWQPAAPISWRHRCHAWLEPINYLLATVPVTYAKKFGGAVGDAASLKLLVEPTVLDDNPFDWSPFNLDYPNNPFPLQSSDHTCEAAAINWVCALAAQIHKIALDLRVLASHGMVQIRRAEGHAGSSSMPHKTNPYRWEKVCSICRHLSGAQAEVWAVSAHNSLERTLDTSWQLKRLLRGAFHDCAYALQEMASVDVVINFTASASALAFSRDKISSDRDLTRRVLAGETRWTAYQEMLNKTNQQG